MNTELVCNLDPHYVSFFLFDMVYYGPLKLTVLILREDQQNYGAPYGMGSCPFAIFLPALVELFIAQFDIYGYYVTLLAHAPGHTLS